MALKDLVSDLSNFNGRSQYDGLDSQIENGVDYFPDDTSGAKGFTPSTDLLTKYNKFMKDVRQSNTLPNQYDGQSNISAPNAGVRINTNKLRLAYGTQGEYSEAEGVGISKISHISSNDNQTKRVQPQFLSDFMTTPIAEYNSQFSLSTPLGAGTKTLIVKKEAFRLVEGESQFDTFSSPFSVETTLSNYDTSDYIKDLFEFKNGTFKNVPAGISNKGKPITKTFGEVADPNNFIGFTHPFILRETGNQWGFDSVNFDVNDTIDGVQPPFPYTAGLSAGEPYIYKNLAGEGGEFFTNVEIGSRVLINGAETGCYVKAVDKVNARVQLTDFPPQDFGSNSDVIFRTFKKDYVIGAYDVYNDNYLISMQQANGDYQTLVYDEQAAGWVTFYDYKPLLAQSLFNRFYTTSNGNLWIHNSENVSRNTFYANDPVTSSIEFIFNQQPSLVKTFKTIEYEGSSGWEVEKVESDQTGLVLSNLGSWQNETDNIALIKSYYEGEYIENGITKRAGFCRKENRYVANVVNNSPAKIGEVILGNQTSGVKGYYTTVKLRLDTTTAPGEMKELFSVGTEFVPSSY